MTEQRFVFILEHIAIMRRIVVSNASRASLSGIKAQLGYVMLMARNIRKANMKPYGYKQWHRISCIALSAKVLALIPSYELGYIICETI